MKTKRRLSRFRDSQYLLNDIKRGDVFEIADSDVSSIKNVHTSEFRRLRSLLFEKLQQLNAHNSFYASFANIIADSENLLNNEIAKARQRISAARKQQNDLVDQVKEKLATLETDYKKVK